MDLGCSNNMIHLEAKIRRELTDILYQEELLQFQRSWEEWITSGDRNTKSYHAATRVRKATSVIKAITKDNGDWVTDDEEIK